MFLRYLQVKKNMYANICGKLCLSSLGKPYTSLEMESLIGLWNFTSTKLALSKRELLSFPGLLGSGTEIPCFYMDAIEKQKKKKEKRKNSGAQACLTVPLLRHLFLSALSNHEFTRFIKAHNKGGSHCVVHPHRKLECVKLNKQLQ